MKVGALGARAGREQTPKKKNLHTKGKARHCRGCVNTAGVSGGSRLFGDGDTERRRHSQKREEQKGRELIVEMNSRGELISTRLR